VKKSLSPARNEKAPLASLREVQSGAARVEKALLATLLELKKHFKQPYWT
jgi:hypothetical protein